MRIAGIVRESIVDGPGIRYVVFTQGCPHACQGCHNPLTHDPAGGYEISPDELASDFLRETEANPLLSGLSISGGEPLLQAKDLLPLAKAARKAGLGLWLYTGYTIEEIAEAGDACHKELLKMTDVLVDGRFDLSLRTLEDGFVGSSNQRVIGREELRKYTM
ncbi:MAG: anaerobic ribonucleoside-triphosphate reductase activating protein [Synergistaceae bacterium]|jgi:anaerobic ribonucleoside-triphosphate reductase activating protein|nr:anaerobic ribonucleoside-triphosphate reductase activating protein [Synergistaceae bacterium]